METSELVKLYEQISICHVCPKMDKHKVIRNISAVSSESKVFILSQALAENQLRLSGVNFFQQNGKIGNTGRQLETFLNLINLSVYPPNEIHLSNGTVNPKRQSGYFSVYNTEITQCYPGKATKKGDRLPDKVEITSCLNNNFFKKEVEIIRPKLILLMGKLSSSTFYNYILKKNFNNSLTQLQDTIIKENKIPTTTIFGSNIGYLPIQHASGVNPNFKKMCENKSLISLVKSFLYE